MTIKASGSLSLSEIRSEFGGSVSPISLSSYYRGGSNVGTLPSWNSTIPNSGPISIGAFYSKTKYYPGSASWYSVGSFSWTSPDWCEVVYVTGAGGGAGGGYCADTGCQHDAGAGGGGSSGQMCTNYAIGVTRNTTYGVWVGGGGGNTAGGGSSGFSGLTLAGGNPGGGGGVCSYFMNGTFYGGGTIATGGGIFGYNGGGGYAWHGGDGGAGYRGYGGGARSNSQGWGGSATNYGGGGGGAAATGLNGGGYVGGGNGYQGFISITW